MSLVNLLLLEIKLTSWCNAAGWRDCSICTRAWKLRCLDELSRRYGSIIIRTTFLIGFYSIALFRCLFIALVLLLCEVGYILLRHDVHLLHFPIIVCRTLRNMPALHVIHKLLILVRSHGVPGRIGCLTCSGLAPS